jgi:hypothetical protein
MIIYVSHCIKDCAFMSRTEEEGLDGMFGDSISIAYKFLLSICKAIDAERLIQ